MSEEESYNRLDEVDELSSTFSNDKKNLVQLDTSEGFISYELDRDEDLSAELSTYLSDINVNSLSNQPIANDEVIKKVGLLTFSVISAMADMYIKNKDSLDNISSPSNIKNGNHSNINAGLEKFKSLYNKGENSSDANSSAKFVYDNFSEMVENTKKIFKKIKKNEKVVASADPNKYKKSTQAILAGTALGAVAGPWGLILGAASGLLAVSTAVGVANNSFDLSNAESTGRTVGGIVGNTGAALKDTWNDVWGTGKNIKFGDKLSSVWNSLKSTVGAYFNGATKGIGGSKVGGGTITAATLALLAVAGVGMFSFGKKLAQDGRIKLKEKLNENKAWKWGGGIAALGAMGLYAMKTKETKDMFSAIPEGRNNELYKLAKANGLTDEEAVSYVMIVPKETGKSNNPFNDDKFIFTKVSQNENKGEKSSAYGPSQITKTLANSYLTKKERLFSLEEIKYLTAFVTQGEKMLEYESKKGGRNEYDYGGAGQEYFRTQPAKKLYYSIAFKMWKDHIKSTDKNIIAAAKKWRGPRNDSQYFETLNQYFS